MMQKMRTFYLTGSEIFDGFSGPFYYENYNSSQETSAHNTEEGHLGMTRNICQQ